MRVFFFLILAAMFSAFRAAQPKKVIFFGDSITEAGVHPGGYIDLLRQKLRAAGRDQNLELVGAGIGGNKVYDLYFRLEDEVLAQKPDLVFIYVGINDVWHKRSFGTGTDPDKFERFYTRIIEKIRTTGAQVVVCTPTVIGERKNFVNELDGDLNRYAEIIRLMAARLNVPVVDLHTAFIDYIRQNNPLDQESGILTSDRVHLNAAGNQLVADQMWPFLP